MSYIGLGRHASAAHIMLVCDGNFNKFAILIPNFVQASAIKSGSHAHIRFTKNKWNSHKQVVRSIEANRIGGPLQAIFILLNKTRKKKQRQNNVLFILH